MPLIPTGLGKGLLERVKQRVEREIGRGLENLGLKDKEKPPAPQRRGPPRGEADIILRIREAVRQEPPKLVYALYQAVDAKAPTWRHLACYSLRDRGSGGPLLFAACEKENWAVECFGLSRIRDLQVTNKPWPFAPLYPIEF